MPLVALTGGIASGKSTIARRLAEHGAVVVDADQVVRDVQRPGSPVLAEIAVEFGDRMLGEDGSLDRAALGGRVFGDAAAVAAAQRDRASGGAHRIEAAVRRGARRATPTRWCCTTCRSWPRRASAIPWDLIVVAYAPAAERVRRLVALRGLSEAEAAARIASQVTDEERLRIADVVIDTSGTLEHTLAQADELWAALPQHIEDRRTRLRVN